MGVKPVKLGIVGCGNISSIYCQNAGKLEALEPAACADLIPERAQQRAAEYNIPKVCTTEELLARFYHTCIKVLSGPFPDIGTIVPSNLIEEG